MTPSAEVLPGVAADDPLIRVLADRGPYVGVTAWSDPSLAELYPPTAKTSEERRRHYAAQFAITVVDSGPRATRGTG